MDQDSVGLLRGSDSVLLCLTSGKIYRSCKELNDGKFMPTATVTSKGQVTIPQAVRRALHLEAGVRVEFTPNDDGSYSLRAASRPVTDLFDFFGPYQGEPLSVGAMNAAMMDGAAEVNR